MVRSVRTPAVDLAPNLPKPLESSDLVLDLFKAWDKLNHVYVTVPRRELAAKRNLLRFSTGEFFIIEEDGVKKAVSMSERLVLGDRGLAELTETADPELTAEIEDKLYVFYDEFDRNANTKKRRREYFNVFSRIERPFMIQHVEMLGISFLSDDLSTEAYWRIAQNAGRYRAQSSTNESVKFLSWMINANFTVEYLWTADGANFYREGALKFTGTSSKGKYIGSLLYFPTSHVLLKYDAEKTPYIDLAKMQELFLVQAPINVVLDGVLALIAPFNMTHGTVNGSHTNMRFMAKAE